jgi:hypothetical protein
MNESEFFLRNKIANELSVAWENMLLKNLYSGDLLVSMIVDFIREGDGETLR